MQFGFNLPGTMDGDELCRFARSAEALGFESVWTGDHIVLPTAGTNQYPYSADGSFPGQASAPFLETLTLLSYIGGCTERIRIGSTVVILPYRNPIVQAKMFASLDVLTKGRVICGVGVGWLEKEFDVLGVPYSERGPMSDECLAVFKSLWTEEHPEFHGKFFDFDGIQSFPKPIQKPHIPIWVGGHTRRAIRRTVNYGDAWHPSRQTPEHVEKHLPYLRQQAEAAGRNPDDITISLKRTVHFTDIGIPEGDKTRSNAAMIGTTQQVIDDVLHCQELGIHQLTYDFRASSVDDCIRTMDHFAEKVVPAVLKV